jgi:hypothetical protein
MIAADRERGGYVVTFRGTTQHFATLPEACAEAAKHKPRYARWLRTLANCPDLAAVEARADAERIAMMEVAHAP